MKYDVPIWKKANLTIEEAAAYFGIGMNKLRELTEDENCKFVLYIGSKRLIKRQMFEKISGAGLFPVTEIRILRWNSRPECDKIPLSNSGLSTVERSLTMSAKRKDKKSESFGQERANAKILLINTVIRI